MKIKDKPLCLIGASILAVLAMLAGTTFAWFTGAAYNKDNKVKAENLSIAAYAYDGAPDYGVELASQRNLSEDKTPLMTGDAWKQGARFVKYLEVRNRGAAAVRVSLHFTVADDSSVNSLWYRFCQLDAGWREQGGQGGRRPMNTLENLGDMFNFTLEPQGVLRFKLEYGVNDDTRQYGNLYLEADAVVTAALANETEQVVNVYDTVDFSTMADCTTFRLMRDIEGDAVLDRLANVDLNGFTLDGNIALGTREKPIMAAGSAVIGSKAAGGVITGRLSLYTPNADISQYGAVGSINMANMANQSLYVFGTAKSEIEASQGRLVLEKSARVPKLVIPAWVGATVRVHNDGVIETLDARIAGHNPRPVVTGNAVQSVTQGTSADVSGATRWDGDLLTEPAFADGAYQVKKAAELAWIADGFFRGRLARANVRLTADIDLNHREWNPLGVITPYAGEFDGQGHTVRNLQIFEGAQGSGLFGTVSGAVIRGVTVDTAHLKNVGSDSGVLVGRSLGATLENCRVKNAILAADSGAASVGGLVGLVQSGAFGAANCTVSDTRVSGYFSLGGLIGFCKASGAANMVIAGCAVENVTVAASPYKGENTVWTGKYVQTHSFIGMAQTDDSGVITLSRCAIRNCSHNGDADVMIGGAAVNAWTARGSGNIVIE